MSNSVIGFAGMTHLGIIYAGATAAKGFRIVGYHDDESLVDALGRGELPVREPGLPELMTQYRDRMTFSSDPSCLGECDIIYVAADVPTDDDGKSDLKPIQMIIGQVLKAMNPEALLVILCQVPPGFTRLLPRAPARLFYQVETLIFGAAVERALKPERFIVGCADPAIPLPPALAGYLRTFGCPVLPMRYESAELAKIAINVCLVASVSAANTMAEICEHIGADWSEITPALRLDRRIGPYSYIQPGLGISGGNLERDLATVLKLSETHRTEGGVVSAWIANSRHRKNWAFEKLQEMVLRDKPGAAIAVLGLAYKENTHSTRNSPALLLIEQLTSCQVTAYDPAVSASSVRLSISGAASALEAVNGADAVVIMTPWPEFKNIDPATLSNRMHGRTVIDPYRLLDAKAVHAAGLDYAALGMKTITR
jgi:UDPglucose 6-dehydrogenase